MTDDEIIEMARQAGCVEDKHYKGEVIFISNDALERFAKLVAAKKQEDIIQIIKETPFSNWFQADVIEAIRARGEA